jgi:hypothetical protein
MKTRRYDDGGRTFSAEQEAWLGGADRTDPYILARMEKAVPTKMAPATAARERVAAAAEEPDYIANIGRNYGAVDPADIRAKLDEPVTRTATTAKAPAKPSKVTDTGDETARLLKRAPSSSAYPDESRRGSAASSKPTASAAPARKMTREESIEAIPRDKNKVVGGERIDSSELGRNVSNTLNATAGLSVPGFVGKMTQKQYNALAALRRSEEGLNAAEAAAVLQGLRENKTLNPMAWMAGPKGMAENFKKGGAVKKMAKGGMTSMPTASKRADGIASKGKTKCKIY